tara:strand:+ start:458 stop:970 length:513 start_codon:yes stop_codon:yes gene_type:complete
MEIIYDFARAYPAICLIAAFILKDLYLLVFLIISDVLNGIFKYSIAKPLMGDKDYGILLGKGTRPKGASHCGIWKDPPGYKTKSYGMPSGHSQGATGFTTYLVLDNLSKGGSLSDISNVILIAFGILVPYSRVVLNCHTIQQVIIGGILGIILGALAWNMKPSILSLINK